MVRRQHNPWSGTYEREAPAKRDRIPLKCKALRVIVSGTGGVGSTGEGGAIGPKWVRCVAPKVSKKGGFRVTVHATTGRASSVDEADDSASGSTVTFAETAWERVVRLSAVNAKAPEEVLTDALALEEWYTAVRQRGERIFVQRPDGTLHEVVAAE